MVGWIIAMHSDRGELDVQWFLDDVAELQCQVSKSLQASAFLIHNLVTEMAAFLYRACPASTCVFSTNALAQVQCCDTI